MEKQSTSIPMLKTFRQKFIHFVRCVKTNWRYYRSEKQMFAMERAIWNAYKQVKYEANKWREANEQHKQDSNI